MTGNEEKEGPWTCPKTGKTPEQEGRDAAHALGAALIVVIAGAMIAVAALVKCGLGY